MALDRPAAFLCRSGPRLPWNATGRRRCDAAFDSSRLNERGRQVAPLPAAQSCVGPQRPKDHQPLRFGFEGSSAAGSGTVSLDGVGEPRPRQPAASPGSGCERGSHLCRPPLPPSGCAPWAGFGAAFSAVPLRPPVLQPQFCLGPWLARLRGAGLWPGPLQRLLPRQAPLQPRPPAAIATTATASFGHCRPSPRPPRGLRVRLGFAVIDRLGHDNGAASTSSAVSSSSLVIIRHRRPSAPAASAAPVHHRLHRADHHDADADAGASCGPVGHRRRHARPRPSRSGQTVVTSVFRPPRLPHRPDRRSGRHPLPRQPERPSDLHGPTRPEYPAPPAARSSAFPSQ